MNKTFCFQYFLGRYSPGHYYQGADNELINGAPSKQYYDNMISQINDQIQRVSEGGAPSQPFNVRTQQQNIAAAAAVIPDDDNEWC